MKQGQSNGQAPPPQSPTGQTHCADNDDANGVGLADPSPQPSSCTPPETSHTPVNQQQHITHQNIKCEPATCQSSMNSMMPSPHHPDTPPMQPQPWANVNLMHHDMSQQCGSNMSISPHHMNVNNTNAYSQYQWGYAPPSGVMTN